MSVQTGLPKTPHIRHPLNNEILTVADLPKNGIRWTPARKAILVLAVREGLISQEKALADYSLTAEEYEQFGSLFDVHGVAGLRITRDQWYRSPAQPGLLLDVQDEPQEEGKKLELLVVGDTTIDRNERVVTVGRRYVHLTHSEFDIAELLALNAGRVVTRESFMKHLYDDRNRARPEFKILDVFVCKTRKKLYGSDGRRRIEGVWGRGYRLITEV